MSVFNIYGCSLFCANKCVKLKIKFNSPNDRETGTGLRTETRIIVDSVLALTVDEPNERWTNFVQNKPLLLVKDTTTTTYNKSIQPLTTNCTFKTEKAISINTSL